MESDVRRRIRRSTRFSLVAITISMLATSCFAQTAVSLSPKDGPPTTTLRVSGSGFTPYAQIDLYFDSQDQALAVADAAGAFSQVAIQAPKSAVPGNHWITAAERSGRLVKQKIFQVHVNWTEFHTKDMRRENPYENVLSVDNVGSLRLFAHYKTGGAVRSSPAVVNGVVYIGSDDNNVYALSAKGLLWSYPTGGAVYSSPAVMNGVVYVGSGDHNLYALDATTGAQIWIYPTGGGMDSSPAVAGGVVYVGSDDGYVYALDASTGVLLWSYATQYYVASLAVENGVVYVRSGLNVCALNATTGTLLWSDVIGWSGTASPAVAKGVVYVAAAPPLTFYALAATTGAVLWSYPIDATYSSPAVANGVLYFGSSGHEVYALNARTGEKLWSFSTSYWLYSSPAVANGVVYIGSYEGRIYALDARTGALLWSNPTQALVESSPAVVNGTVYVGSDDGRVYAFGLPKELAPQPPKRPDPKTLRPDFKLKPVSTT